SIRAKAFSYVTMCTGKDGLEAKMREYAKRSKSKDYADKLSDIEKNTYGDMKIVQEMLARGYEFAPIELEKADAKRFTITDDGKIMPSFSAIDGMGPAAAEGIADAVKDGPFSSLKNFKDRTKVSQTVIDKMVELGILGGLPADDQISLLDLM
ncbi:MAG: PolC-type DNA polymerase III, partial [Eubacterium sp.]|nr:PolC-type DNA polymerase III [Eubacterium sp.]